MKGVTMWIEDEYVDTSHGFKVKLFNVPMEIVRGEPVLAVNRNDYVYSLARVLAFTDKRWTHDQCRWVRLLMGGNTLLMLLLVPYMSEDDYYLYESGLSSKHQYLPQQLEDILRAWLKMYGKGIVFEKIEMEIL